MDMTTRWTALLGSAFMVYCVTLSLSSQPPPPIVSDPDASLPIENADLTSCGLRKDANVRFNAVTRTLVIDEPIWILETDLAAFRIVSVPGKVYYFEFRDRLFLSANSSFSISRLPERSSITIEQGRGCVFDLGEKKFGEPEKWMPEIIVLEPGKPAIWKEPPATDIQT